MSKSRTGQAKLTTEQIIESIREAETLYNICFRQDEFGKAKVGFMFYDPHHRNHEQTLPKDREWTRHLMVHGYYDSLELAALAEFKRIFG